MIGALQRADKIDFIQVRHEEMAAFMAVAHAKFTGEIGVCLATGGLCGQAEATVRGASYQQELNLDRMFADVALFAQEASAPAQVRHLIDRCVRVARGDAVSIWIAQFVGQKINVLDYYEAQGQPLSVHIDWMRSRGWGKAWVILPHDGAHGDKVFATSYESAIREARL